MVTDVMRISEDMLKAKIKSESYHQPEGTTVTVCILELHNGFYVVGKSACISQSFFDEQKGREMAKQDAISRMWELEGYAAKEAAWTRKQLAIEMLEAED